MHSEQHEQRALNAKGHFKRMGQQVQAEQH